MKKIFALIAFCIFTSVQAAEYTSIRCTEGDLNGEKYLPNSLSIESDRGQSTISFKSRYEKIVQGTMVLPTKDIKNLISGRFEKLKKLELTDEDLTKPSDWSKRYFRMTLTPYVRAGESKLQIAFHTADYRLAMILTDCQVE